MSEYALIVNDLVKKLDDAKVTADFWRNRAIETEVALGKANTLLEESGRKIEVEHFLSEKDVMQCF